MSFVVKRKRDTESDQKNPKAAFGDKEKDFRQQEIWPMYNHPNGGTVKLTPWGSLRQWTDPETGKANTKFEDASFHDLSFAMSPANVRNQCYDLPTTPKSLNASSSGISSPADGNRFNFSPSNEAESYVIEGYGQQTTPGTQFTQEYSQEQENYLGMEDEEFAEDSTMN